MITSREKEEIIPISMKFVLLGIECFFRFYHNFNGIKGYFTLFYLLSVKEMLMNVGLRKLTRSRQNIHRIIHYKNIIQMEGNIPPCTLFFITTNHLVLIAIRKSFFKDGMFL